MFCFWQKRFEFSFTVNVFRFWNKSPANANANTNWRRRKTNYKTTFNFAITVGWSHLHVTLMHLLGNGSNNYSEVKLRFSVVCSCMQFYLQGGKFMVCLVWSVWWHSQLIYGLSGGIVSWIYGLSRMVCLLSLPVDIWFVSYGLSVGITSWYVVCLVWSVCWHYQLIYDLSRLVCLVALPVGYMVCVVWPVVITSWYMVCLVWFVWWHYQLIYLIALCWTLSIHVGVRDSFVERSFLHGHCLSFRVLFFHSFCYFAFESRKCLECDGWNYLENICNGNSIQSGSRTLCINTIYKATCNG
jgi:hypothetical protein